jgi:peptidoglycan/LPS O-acetylase OafA/YrhL
VKWIRAAIAMAIVGLLVCIWLLVHVTWYNFFAFMLLAQPLIVLALLIFLGALVKEIRRRDALVSHSERRQLER